MPSLGPPPRTRGPNWPGIYLAVGLTTLATMLLELSLTRIFSVVFSYHFAFLAISIALFGIGAGGVLSYMLAGRKDSAGTAAKLGGLAALAALLVVTALATVLKERVTTSWSALAVVYFASALPFLAAGTVVATAIAETVERVNRVYFADLLGAGAACAMMVPLLDALGGPNAVLSSAIVYALASVAWFAAARRRGAALAAAGLSVLLATAVVLNARRPFLDVQFAKGKPLLNERLVKWDSAARVSVAGAEGEPLRLIVDADDAGRLPHLDLDSLTPESLSGLLHRGPGLPYQLRPGAKALVLRAGPGWEIARALVSGSRDVTGVEPNRTIAGAIMRGQFASYTDGIYQRPGVRIVVEDGRSFIRRTREKYDVIQANLVESSPSPAGAAFALSESSLYTTDAFRDYLAHLAPGGLLAFTTRASQPPRESLRIASLARAALDRDNAWRNVAVLREETIDGPSDTVLVGESPLAAADLEKLRAEAAHDRLRILYLPGQPSDRTFAALLESNDQRGVAFDVSPVSDNRPFFFYTARPAQVWAYLKGLNPNGGVNALALLFALLLVSALATVAMLALSRVVLPRQRAPWRFEWYFAFLGAGYILIQVALVQRFVLFLGNPAEAFTVIVFAVLISSGLGGYASDRIAGPGGRRLPGVLALLAAIVALLALSLSTVLGAAGGWPWPAKIALAGALTAPAGFLMGVPFPAGLRRLAELNGCGVRWAWSVNAAASVLGSVAAVVLAVHFGLALVLIAGAAMYALAYLSLDRRKPCETQQAPVPAAHLTVG